MTRKYCFGGFAGNSIVSLRLAKYRNRSKNMCTGLSFTSPCKLESDTNVQATAPLLIFQAALKQLTKHVE